MVMALRGRRHGVHSVLGFGRSQGRGCCSLELIRWSIHAGPTRSLAMAMTASAPDATSLGIDLAVDTSAVIAVLLREPGCEPII